MSELTDPKSVPVTVAMGEDRLLSLYMNEAEESQQPDPNLVNESTGRCVRLALTEGPDGQQIIQEVPEQDKGDIGLPPENNLIQHIQIQPLGEEISQGEAITLSLEEAQQLLQQQIVAGEGVEGVQPGIYQILGSGLTQSAEGHIFVTAGDGVSLLQSTGAEGFSGFEGQNQPMFFQGSAENLQNQLEQGNNSENEATSHINMTNVSTAGTVPTTMEELSTHIQSNVQMLGTGTEHIDSVPMDVSTESMPVNQSAPSSQSENVLHVDFHVAQPGNLLQMVKQAEEETAKIEQTATISVKEEPPQENADAESWSPLLSVGLQPSSAQTQLTQTVGLSSSQSGGEKVQGEQQMDSIDVKIKSAPVVTPKKPAEIRPDLSKPIEVKEEMEVVLNGKRCMLAVDPDTGKLTAYPLLPPEGRRRRGRPKKSEQEKKQQSTEPSVETDQTSSAAEGLLILSNTGPDGIRRSGRVRKKAKTLDDYEMTEVSSDDEGSKVDNESGKRLKLDTQRDYIPPISFPTPTPVKRGRGRPRRYPPPGETVTTQIPTMIIPSSDGQTIMMAPIQGFGNLQAFQDQLKNITFLSKNVTDPSITTSSLTTSTLVNDDTSQFVTMSDTSFPINQPVRLFDITTPPNTEVSANTDGSLLPETVMTGELDGATIVIQSRIPAQDVTDTAIDNPIATLTADTLTADTLTDAQDTQNVTAAPTEKFTNQRYKFLPPDRRDTARADTLTDAQDTLNVTAAPTDETAGPDLDDTVGTTEDPETKVAIDSMESIDDLNRITFKNSADQPTIIQIPENLLPMFMQKKEPLKLGLKSSEDELDKMRCVKCNFQAYYDQQYQDHIATHTEDVSKCKCCSYVTFDKDDLLIHFRKMHPRCICDVCDFMAEHAYVIKRHMMRHNADGCRCDICGKVYKDQYVLKMHIKMVHMPAEVLFECMICSKKFTRKAHLKRHLRIHDPEKPFKCPHCIYRGCEKSDISKHLLIHEEPRHICEVCGKAFRHIKNKELHLKRHNGQRDYKCGVCDFYGYTFTDIRKHIERKHTDAKALICDKCGSAFKTDWHLREHQRLGNCEMFMIEQALAIATSDGGSSKATIQIPTSLSMDGQHMQISGQNIILDNNTGQFNIKVEQVKLPDENITLTEEQIQAAVAQGQIIDATPEDLIMHVSGDVNQVKLGTVSDVCLSDGDEDNEDEEEEDETEDDFVERNIHGMVSEMSD